MLPTLSVEAMVPNSAVMFVYFSVSVIGQPTYGCKLSYQAGLLNELLGPSRMVKRTFGENIVSSLGPDQFTLIIL